MGTQSNRYKNCEACGAEPRDGAQFCFNCGAELVEEKVKGVSNAWFREEIVQAEPAVEKVESEPVVNEPVVEAKPESKPEIVAPTDAVKKTTPPPVKTKESAAEKVVNEKVSGTSSPKLRSAASIRQKSKLGRPKEVEVSWDSPATGSNLKFLLASIVLAVLAIAMLLVSLYIR